MRPGPPFRPPIPLRQSTSASGGSGLTLTLPSNPVAGSWLVVSYTAIAASIPVISGGGVTTWYQIGRVAITSGSQIECCTFIGRTDGSSAVVTTTGANTRLATLCELVIPSFEYAEARTAFRGAASGGATSIEFTNPLGVPGLNYPGLALVTHADRTNGAIGKCRERHLRVSDVTWQEYPPVGLWRKLVEAQGGTSLMIRLYARQVIPGETIRCQVEQTASAVMAVCWNVLG